MRSPPSAVHATDSWLTLGKGRNEMWRTEMIRWAEAEAREGVGGEA